MQLRTQTVSIGNHVIDLVKLPEVAQQELMSFYEFLVFKYQGSETQAQDARQMILKAIFQEADGKLPVNYTFHREELHER